jgi:8-oxo-dGTP pyrophosphatase MutT (NUDIX family)
MNEKRNGNFIIKSSQQVYKNPWIEVVEEKVVRSDGKDGLFGIVKMGKGGIAVMPIDDEDYVYLTKEFHYAISETDIETVGGGVDGDEDFVEAAKRELEEELGIEAEEWIDLGLVNPMTTALQAPQKLFLAKKLSFGNNNQEDTESVELVKIKLEEAVQMVIDSIITHAPSCVLILKAEKYLNNK